MDRSPGVSREGGKLRGGSSGSTKNTKSKKIPFFTTYRGVYNFVGPPIRLAHGPQPREPCPMGPQPRELQPR